MDWIQLALHTVQRQDPVNRVTNPWVLQHAGDFLTENRLKGSAPGLHTVPQHPLHALLPHEAHPVPHTIHYINV